MAAGVKCTLRAGQRAGHGVTGLLSLDRRVNARIFHVACENER
jgi:hypothetical protein